MDEQIAALAELMGVMDADVRGFVACLSVWINKGYTLEAAIAKHMAQMHRFIDSAVQIASNPDARIAAANGVWDEVNAA